MKIKDLRTKSDSELQKLLAKTREEQREIRFKVSQRQHKNYQELSDKKKAVARILTVMREKKLLHELKQQSDK